MFNVSPWWNSVEIEILPQHNDAGAILQHIPRGAMHGLNRHGLLMYLRGRRGRRCRDALRDLAEEVEHVLQRGWVVLGVIIPVRKIQIYIGEVLSDEYNTVGGFGLCNKLGGLTNIDRVDVAVVVVHVAIGKQTVGKQGEEDEFGEGEQFVSGEREAGSTGEKFQSASATLLHAVEVVP